MKCNITTAVYMELLTLHICLIFFISQVGGLACTWPAEIQGSWTDSLKGAVSFTGSTMTGWTIEIDSDSGPPNQVHDEWECVNIDDFPTDGYVIMNTTRTFTVILRTITAYRCMQLTKITDHSYRYYQIEPVQTVAANDRVFINEDDSLSTAAALCLSAHGASGPEYQVMIATGNEALAKVRCPYEFIGLYEYEHTSPPAVTTCGAAGDTWNMCTDTTQMSFDYNSCSTQVAYSVSDTVWCVDNVPLATTNYAMLYNPDASTDESTYRFTCMAISADNTAASISPQHCWPDQDPVSFPLDSAGTSLGATVTLTQTSTTCPPCPVLSNPVQGSVVVSTEGATTIANYSCDPGNSLFGAQIRTCLLNGTWDPPDVPSCTCPPPVDPSHGAVTMAVQDGVTTVTYTCDADYVLVGDAERTCLTDTNSWNGSDPTCDLCAALTAPAFGTKSVVSIGVTSQATFKCDLMYSMSGVADSFCLPDLTWNSTEPTCTFCQTLTTLFSGNIAYTTSDTVTSATCTCAPSYTIVGSSPLNCLPTGAWDNSLPACVCNYPAVPADGGVVVSNSNTTATYTCDLYFTINGPAVRECRTNGMGWDGTNPNCVGCSSKSQPANGNVDVTTDGTVTSATFRCDLNHSMAGEQVLVCEVTGSWSNSDPVCNLCTAISTPTGGSITLTTNDITTSAVYRCDNGRTLNGESEPVCQSDGTWSVDTTSITCALCVDLPDLDQGSKTMTTNGTQTKVTFSCNADYQLTGSTTALCDGNGQWDVVDQSCAADTSSSDLPWVPIVAALGGLGGVLVVAGVVSLFFNFKWYKQVNKPGTVTANTEKGQLPKPRRNVVTSPPMNQRLSTGKYRIQPSPTVD